MMALVDLGTWVGHAAPWPTWGHPSDPWGGGRVGGAAVPGPREGAPSSCFFSRAKLRSRQIRRFSSDFAYRGLAAASCDAVSGIWPISPKIYCRRPILATHPRGPTGRLVGPNPLMQRPNMCLGAGEPPYGVERAGRGGERFSLPLPLHAFHNFARSFDSAQARGHTV